METIRTIVRHVLRRAWPSDAVLRPLYPEEDLGPAEERFPLFLVQYWGGPTTYSEHARPPAAADAARAVRGDPGSAKQRWLVHFRAGLDEAALTPEQDAQFWDYVTHAAQFMVNSAELSARALAEPVSRRARRHPGPRLRRRVGAALGRRVEADQHHPRAGSARRRRRGSRTRRRRSALPTCDEPGPARRTARGRKRIGTACSPRRSGRPRRGSPASAGISAELVAGAGSAPPGSTRSTSRC